jgi:hypothetical protein
MQAVDRIRRYLDDQKGEGRLAWKLCWNDLVVDDVAVHSNVGGGGLGGLSREKEGEETVNTKQAM